MIAGGGDQDDDSQFLNNSSEGIELEPTDEGQTSNDGEDIVGPSCEVY
jgi:hypothetical protein